jgi:CBS domain-containing protein
MPLVNAPLSSIPARDAMHSPVVSCDPTTPMSAVASLMQRHHIHCVVVDGIVSGPAGERLVWGVISDQDLARAILMTEGDVQAGLIAGTEALTVDVEDNLETVCSVLVEHASSHAIVVEDERPVGVVSTLDIARIYAP